MSRKRRIQTLEKICCAYYVTIFQNIEDQNSLNICIKYFNAVISLSAIRGLHFDSQLTNNLEEFIKYGDWNMYRIQVLVIPQAKKIRLHTLLESVGLAEKKSFFKMMGKQCPFLEILELRSLHQSSLLISILPSLTCLSKLMLSNSDCDDDGLTVIFKTCHCLEVLDISSCPITDKGIQNLNKSLCILVCNKLKQINIWKTQITVLGAVTVLTFFSNLQRFYLPCWMRISALQKMIAEGNKDKIPQLRSLNHSQCSHMPIEKEWLFYSLICPKTESIHYGSPFSLKLQPLPFNALQYFHLKKLSLFLFDIATSVFDHYQFIQSLKFCGKTITHLTLHAYNSFLDVYALGQCCPLLEKLSIDVQKIIFKPNSMDMLILQPFQHLIILSYLHVNYIDNSEELTEAVKYLLRYCIRIKWLKLCAFPDLTDDILLNIWSVNRMTELETLWLDSIPFITKHSIAYILHQENALNFIVLYNCLNISDSDKREIQNYIAENRLDVHYV